MDVNVAIEISKILNLRSIIVLMIWYQPVVQIALAVLACCKVSVAAPFVIDSQFSVIYVARR